MAAALALLVLLAGSMLIVRIAPVFLRLTGLPDHVARFQSVSALTGAGFTTSESETIVNFTIRRRIIVVLMVLGNIGMVSVVSTFIIALVDKSDSGAALVQQLVSMALAVIFLSVLMVNKTLDRWICAGAERVSRKIVRKRPAYHTIVALDEDLIVAGHHSLGADKIPLRTLLPESTGPTPLAIRGQAARSIGSRLEESEIATGETLICFGSLREHQELARRLASWDRREPSEIASLLTEQNSENH